MANRTRTLIYEFLGYTAASGVALAADVGILVGLVHHGVHYVIAASISFLVGLVIVYLASIWWIFERRTSEGKRHIEIGVFLLTGVVGLALNIGILWFCTSVLGWYYLASKALSVLFVFSFNFLSRKRMLFT